MKKAGDGWRREEEENKREWKRVERYREKWRWMEESGLEWTGMEEKARVPSSN